MWILSNWVFSYVELVNIVACLNVNDTEGIPAGRREPYDFCIYFYGLKMTQLEGQNM
jgi:hypothetical protein